MFSSFMSVGARRDSTTPCRQHGLIGDSHLLGEFEIKVGHLALSLAELVAAIAIGWCGLNSQILIVTGETGRMTIGNRLKRSSL